MKKLIILSVVFFSTFISCRKESVCHVDEPETFISSDWLSLQFSPVFTSSSGKNFAFQVSNHQIMPELKYDSLKYVNLAFIKAEERGSYFYWPIPGMALIQNYTMDFRLTQNNFSVTVCDVSNPSQLPDSSILEYCRFRYILIPKAIYRALPINWSNYYAVAAAFNLTL